MPDPEDPDGLFGGVDPLGGDGFSGKEGDEGPEEGGGGEMEFEGGGEVAGGGGEETV